MPKARERFAEFLDQDSLDRLGILYLTTLLQFLVGRKALQNRHRTAADQREQRRRALNLERLCDGGIAR